MLNFIEIEETLCVWMDGRTYVRMHGWTFETFFIRSTQRVKESKSRPIKITSSSTSATNSINAKSVRWSLWN